MQNKQMTPNKDYIIQSLQQQLLNVNMMVAEREAIISQLYDEIEKLKGKSADK